MWEALLKNLPKKNLKPQEENKYSQSNKTYFQLQDLKRRKEQLDASGKSFDARVIQVLDIIQHVDPAVGISAKELSAIMQFRSEYIVKILMALRDRNAVHVERRKEVLNGTTHWRRYYSRLDSSGTKLYTFEGIKK